VLEVHISYHIVVLKRQNGLKVGTDKPKLKVKMQSVSDDDVRKRLLEKPRFELTVKGVFRLGRCYIFWQGVPGPECTQDVPHFGTLTSHYLRHATAAATIIYGITSWHTDTQLFFLAGQAREFWAQRTNVGGDV